MATSTTSASSTMPSGPPPAAGSMATLWPAATLAMPVTLLASLKLMPCLARMRCRVRAISASVPGRMRSRNSTTSTSLPSRRQTEPSSSPMTPAPTTSSRFGTLGSVSAPVEETIVLLVDGDAGQLGDIGAGGDDDALGLEPLLVAAVEA